MTAQMALPIAAEPTTAVRQWTKSDLLGLTLIVSRYDPELGDKIWQFSNVKGNANTVVPMDDHISALFERLWNGERLDP